MNKLFGVLLCVLALLALPAAAAATPATVNSAGDQSDPQPVDFSCDVDPVSQGEQCTLRAAIQTINAHDDFHNTISFTGLSPGPSTITLTAPLPEIQKPTLVSGNGVACGTTSGQPRPCVEITYASSTASPVLTFNMPTAPIPGQLIGAQGVALTNGSVGLRVTGQTRDMFVTNTWIGLHLDGSAGPNTTGILLEGNGVEGVAIGGDSVNSRNVIAHNTRTGIDISDADGTVIAGNYIGSKPDGVTQAGNGSATSDGENIEVTSSAEGTEIGTTLGAGAIATKVCDGGCNVIMDAGADVLNRYASQIDLRGEPGEGETTSSDTTIHGNYIGMAADGETTISRGTPGIGVAVNSSTSVTIGGPAAGDRNRFNSHGTVIANNGGAADLVIQNNWINLVFDGSDEDPNSLHLGIGMNLSGSDSSPPLITQNRIAWVASSNYPAISASNERFVITDNVIGRSVTGAPMPGGGIGIALSNLYDTAGRTTVSGNVIDVSNTSDAAPTGVQLTATDGVDLMGNTVEADPAGAGPGGDGIRLEANLTNTSLRNVVGGDTVEEANTIHANRDAIRISDTASFSNTFGRNTGAANADDTESAPGADRFIDIGTNGPGNGTAANGGIQEPQVNAAGANIAAGTAGSNAVVRVFTKPVSGSADAVGVYLGKATADGTGAWRLTYASPVGEGVPVAATQTDGNGNSSELSAALETDATPPPAPTITDGPSGPTQDLSPAFTFTGNAPGGSFSCAIDEAPQEPCDSGSFTPAVDLSEGAHVFRVVHVDLAENASPAATREFIVDATVAAPQITAGPKSPTRDSTPTFSFSGEAGASFVCAIDSAAPVPCDNGRFTAAKLSDGPHTFAVSQTDPAGNASPVAVRAFRVDTRAPQTRVTKAPARIVPGAPRFKATFRFRSSERGSRFQCKLDGRPWRACRSPRTYNLAPGRHVVRIRAIDRAGNRDRTPAVRRIRVIR